MHESARVDVVKRVNDLRCVVAHQALAHAHVLAALLRHGPELAASAVLQQKVQVLKIWLETLKRKIKPTVVKTIIPDEED
jgi:hypothetical protein